MPCHQPSQPIDATSVPRHAELRATSASEATSADESSSLPYQQQKASTP